MVTFPSTCPLILLLLFLLHTAAHSSSIKRQNDGSLLVVRVIGSKKAKWSMWCLQKQKKLHQKVKRAFAYFYKLNSELKYSPKHVAYLFSRMEETSPLALNLPPRMRGSHTNTFRPIRTTSNHYFVAVKENIKNIFIYSVRFTPQIPSDNSKLRMDILREILPQIQQQIPNPVLSGYNVFSTEAPQHPEQDYTHSQYTVKIKQVKMYNLSGDPKMLLTFLNNGLRNIMSRLNYVEIGRSGKFFNAKDKTPIDNLVMYGGYKANFVYLEKGFFLRVDPAKKIVRNDTVLNVIDSIYQMHKDKEKEERRQFVRNELINKIVMSNYGKTRYYKITDINFVDITTVRLDENLSLIDYYIQKYGIKIQHPKQPLLVTEGRNPDNPTYLLPELMLMTGIPDNFDEIRRKKISDKTIKDPPEKFREITNFMDQIKGEQKIKDFESIGIKMSFNLEKVQSKQIPVPVLELGKNNKVEKGKESFFNLFAKPIFQAKHQIQCWIIHMRNTDISILTDTFKKTAPNLGVSMNITAQPYQSSNVPAIEREIERAIEKGANICCIVIPTSMKTQYKNLKSSCILQQEIVTQVVVDSTLRKKGPQSIATKVLLQIIAKRGNILWVPKISIETEFAAMLVGFQQAKIGSKTLLAICATINSTYTQVYTSTEAYQGNENKFKTMKDLLSKAMAAYVHRNKATPDQVICFQNTCSGDQVSLYQTLFIRPYLEQIQSVYTDARINLSIVMINVKTNERFFGEREGKPSNPPAGTLICQGLVSHNYDFYLISQESRKGTAVPNHYKVVYSQSKVEEGILQEICFSQCFNYVNWTGSIKVPAILQYAKKAANFGADVLSDRDDIIKQRCRF